MLNDLEGAIVSHSYPPWWTHRTGGCTGGMEITEDNPSVHYVGCTPCGYTRSVRRHGGRRCGSFYFDTSCGNGYVATQLQQGVWPPHCRELRFWVRAPGDVVLSVRIVDNTGQELQIRTHQRKGPWRQITVALTQSFPEHWKGKNDGIIHPPIGAVQFLRESSVYVEGLKEKDTMPYLTPHESEKAGISR